MNEQVERIISKAEDKGIIIRASLIQARSGGKSVRHGFALGVHFTLNNLWISVEERMPEIIENNHSKYVIVRSRNRLGESFDIARWDEYFNDWISQNSYAILNVTHWMPIPSVMEGEEK